MPGFPADRFRGRIIIPNQGRGLRSDAVCHSVRRVVDRSLCEEVVAPTLGGFSFRSDWDLPWNPVYSIVKVQEGFLPHYSFAHFFSKI